MHLEFFLETHIKDTFSEYVLIYYAGFLLFILIRCKVAVTALVVAN